MIEVLSPGFYSTIQDLGRFGFAAIGVPCSGVMDRYSTQLANQIIGNSKQDAVLEITLGKCILRFNNQSIICVSGADLSAGLNGSLIDLNRVIQVERNDVLSFNKPVLGARAYLAVKGGFQSPAKLGSRSFYHGITKQVSLRKNDFLPIKKIVNDKVLKYSSVKVNVGQKKKKKMLAYRGPEYDLLSLEQKAELSSVEFVVSNDNNRMGYRLEGLLENKLPSILTSAVLPGTVQLTPSGKLIILMRDCQVTGGYPRILQLSEKAISRLAQKTTNDKIQFIVEHLD